MRSHTLNTSEAFPLSQGERNLLSLSEKFPLPEGETPLPEGETPSL